MNQDLFMAEKVELTDGAKEDIDNLKERAAQFLCAIESQNFTRFAGREFSLGKTNLEQAVMWFVKSIIITYRDMQLAKNDIEEFSNNAGK